MTKRQPVAIDRPYPFDRDESEAGRECRIPGRTGLFLVRAFETNPRTGASWWEVFGPVGRLETNGLRKRDGGQIEHPRSINLVPLRRGRKG